MRLRFLIDNGSWPTDVTDSDRLHGAGASARLDRGFARFINEINQGHRTQAAEALKDLEAVAKEVVEIETENADPDPSYRVRPEIFRIEAQAMFAEYDGDLSGAERLISQAVALEEKLPMAFGPPLIDKPTYELLGEFLLRRGRKDEAHQAFRKALTLTPGRRLAEQGFAASATGK